MVKRRHVAIVPHNLRKAKRCDSKKELGKGNTGVREVCVWCKRMILRCQAMAMESNSPGNFRFAEFHKPVQCHLDSGSIELRLPLTGREPGIVGQVPSPDGLSYRR